MGWDPESKKEELFHSESRFIISRLNDETSGERIAGFVMFRFEKDYGQKLLYWSVPCANGYPFVLHVDITLLAMNYKYLRPFNDPALGDSSFSVSQDLPVIGTWMWLCSPFSRVSPANTPTDSWQIHRSQSE